MMLILILIMMLKFCAKESANLIGLENFGAGLGLCSHHQSNSDQISTHQSPSLQLLVSVKAYQYVKNLTCRFESL